MSLKHVNLEKSNAHEIHARKVREKDQELRNLKKAELQLKVAQDALELTSQSHKKLTLMVSILHFKNLIIFSNYSFAMLIKLQNILDFEILFLQKSSTTPKDLEELKKTKQEAGERSRTPPKSFRKSGKPFIWYYNTWILYVSHSLSSEVSHQNCLAISSKNRITKYFSLHFIPDFSPFLEFKFCWIPSLPNPTSSNPTPLNNISQSSRTEEGKGISQPKIRSNSLIDRQLPDGD